MDPGKGVCADPVNRDAILGKGGTSPRGGNKGRQFSLDRGGDKTWYTVRWEHDNRTRKTTPSRLWDASMHRVSCCAQQEDKKWMSWRCIYSCTYCFYCFRKINHLVPVPFVFILWCKEPCREQYSWTFFANKSRDTVPLKPIPNVLADSRIDSGRESALVEYISNMCPPLYIFCVRKRKLFGPFLCLFLSSSPVATSRWLFMINRNIAVKYRKA